VQQVDVTADWHGTAVAWGAAALLLALLALPAARSRALMFAAPITAALGMLALGTLAFRAGLWVPVVGPIAWVAIVGGVLALRAPTAAAPETDHDLVNARRAVAGGELVEAWARYRQISATSALLPELYDLACELDSGGKDQHAAELFHRIALVDGRFRDVAKRLVRSAHVQSPLPLERESMPSTMGRYELLEPIGRGAMGFVYLGRDPKINRIVALKAVDLAAEVEPDDLDEARKNFLREAEIAGQLSHPNIVTIFDVGETDGLAYIAMEYLRGRHLSEFAAPERLLPVPVVLELLSRTADALDYAHARNIVHRDIKPANIMYDSVSDGLKITDFGIARLIDVGRTRTGIVLGTPAFMSPEQLEGKNVNGHTDLFALGVSLYQLLTGHLPFRGASMTKLMFVIANEPHQSVTELRPDLPSYLNAIVDRALAKDPTERFQSGAEMASAMRSAAA
jgi:serine/threonine-protein kinase